MACTFYVTVISTAVNGVDNGVGVDFLWHLRLGHASCGRIRLVTGIDNCLSQGFQQCTICPLSKQTRCSFPLSNNRADGVFDLVHLDVWGPYRTPTYDGF